jgi:hypothetical protein
LGAGGGADRHADEEEGDRLRQGPHLFDYRWVGQYPPLPPPCFFVKYLE